MRPARLFRILLLLAATLPGFAQVEPNLRTVTDLSDPYKQVAAKSEVMAIYDFTPISRAVFEPFKYLTSQARNGFLPNAPTGQIAQNTGQFAIDVFNPYAPSGSQKFGAGVASPGSGNTPGTARAAGIVFGLRQTTAGPEVRMFWWPRRTLPAGALGALVDRLHYTTSGSNTTYAEIVGTPLYQDSANGVITLINNPDLTLAQVIAATTHVRFSLYTVANDPSSLRTIDLPCPWKISDSPQLQSIPGADSGFYVQYNKFTSTDPLQPGSKRFDPWSEAFNGASTTTGSYTINKTTTATGSTISTMGPTVEYPNDTGITALAAIELLKTNWVPKSSYKVITVGNGSSATSDVVIGNFYYTPDYLSWIFGGTQVRYIDPSDGSVGWVYTDDLALNYGPEGIKKTTTYVKLPNGHYPAVPDAIKDTKPGWANGLPAMTRYQAIKFASINVMLDTNNPVQFAYRFLDPNYGPTSTNPEDLGVGVNPGNHEETKRPSPPSSATFGAPIPPGTDSSQYQRTIRLMTLPNLLAEADVMQARGPRAFDFDLNSNFWTYDVSSPDPMIPQPLNYVLADTYRQLSDNAQNPFDRNLPNAGCANSYLIVFPGQGFNDSYTAAMASDAANVPGNGQKAGGGNADGAYGIANDTASLDPASSDGSFSASILSSVAAFGGGPSATAASNTRNWGAPWVISVSGKTRRIHTIVISVGVPGAYRFKGTNAGVRAPQEQLFRVAQWGDPDRPAWQPSNGLKTPPDLPVQLANIVSASMTQYAKVKYFTGSDPTTLSDAIKAAFGYIVSAGAALAAPATPATGVRSANQAYFGIFKTTLDPQQKMQKLPLWSGNLFSMGIKRATMFLDPQAPLKGTHEVFSFYGYDLGGTNGVDPTDIATGIPDFDVSHLWDSYDLFGAYLNPPTGSPTVHTTGSLTGKPILWNDRTMYTMVGNQRVDWPKMSTPGSTTTIDPAGVLDKLANLYGWDLTTSSQATTTIGKDAATKFAMWVRGIYNASSLGDTNNKIYNRQDIMGDIVNSAPLAIELTPNGDDKLYPAAYDNPFTTGYTDVHARMIVVGTNVGQLECFFEWAATRSTPSGTDDAGNPVYLVDAKATELWSFIPPDFWQALYNLYVTRGIDGAPHSYMVDGDPVLYHVDLPPSDPTRGTLPDTRVSKKENALIAFGHRKGARSYYGLQISDLAGSIKPETPVIAWYINPQNPAGGLPSVTDTNTQNLIRTMGMSTSVPAIATVNMGTVATPILTPKKQDVMFLGGGYSNPEMDARYKDQNSGAYGKGMGRLLLAIEPLTGNITRAWDFRDLTGAIAEGVTPIRLFPGDLSQRLYFADTTGNVWAINNSATQIGSTTVNSGYRLDSAYIGDWLAIPRPIYKSSANVDAANNPLSMRFTTRPDAFRLSGGFPLVNSDNITPLTVIVAIGAGDRNNPTDKDESYSIRTTSYTQRPPKLNRFMVFADRQDSSNLGYDTQGIPDSALTTIPNDGTGWATCYSDPRVVPATGSTPPYLFDGKSGYYITLGTGTLTGNTWNGGFTYDKVLVSPLIKQGLLFFSIFNISNGSGFNCSPNSFTRTFRQCDIMRPLALNLQTTNLGTVGDVQGSVNRSADVCSQASDGIAPCTGLAFYFNSLSSQLVDAGDRVVQGGALSAKQSSGITTSQSGQNTPSIQNVKDTEAVRGIRVRAWRIVR
ncbi:hypothetical protein [Geothrix fermentans]|uniref:hypothetical protein n=1 Tax=Geothrix fermentans TaxID=44676 RepID=UPI00041A4011|nr:hypothetical protein [Geothrix fermentans]